MTDKERQEFKEKLKKQMKDRIKQKKEKYVKTKDLKPPPRYDDVYYKGVEWLDSL